MKTKTGWDAGIDDSALVQISFTKLKCKW